MSVGKKNSGMIVGGIILVSLLMIAFAFMSVRHVQTAECEKGPLSHIQDCNYEQSGESWMNSGWWYSDATGSLNDASCQVITAGEEQLTFSDMASKKPVETSIYKISCETVGFGIAGNCYASQSPAVNGNTRYVKILIAQSCQNARYFEGSKYTIQDGKATSYDWVNPIPNIPDEKTGKVEPHQIYGQIFQKTAIY